MEIFKESTKNCKNTELQYYKNYLKNICPYISSIDKIATNYIPDKLKYLKIEKFMLYYDINAINNNNITNIKYENILFNQLQIYNTNQKNYIDVIITYNERQQNKILYTNELKRIKKIYGKFKEWIYNKELNKQNFKTAHLTSKNNNTLNKDKNSYCFIEEYFNSIDKINKKELKKYLEDRYKEITNNIIKNQFHHVALILIHINNLFNEYINVINYNLNMLNDENFEISKNLLFKLNENYIKNNNYNNGFQLHLLNTFKCFIIKNKLSINATYINIYKTENRINIIFCNNKKN